VEVISPLHLFLVFVGLLCVWGFLEVLGRLGDNITRINPSSFFERWYSSLINIIQKYRKCNKENPEKGPGLFKMNIHNGRYYTRL
jgi:hypothetical protein